MPYSIPKRTSVASSTRSGAISTASGHGRTPGPDADAAVTAATSELERASVGIKYLPESVPFRMAAAVDSGSESGGERALERRWAAGNCWGFCFCFYDFFGGERKSERGCGRTRQKGNRENEETPINGRTAAACEARSIGVSTNPGVARWIETPVGIS